MPFLTRTISVNGGGVTAQVQQRLAATSPHGFEQVIPPNQTDVLLKEPDIVFADCKGMAIVADQDCTVKTNSSSSPTETLILKAGVLLNWIVGDPTSGKFVSGNVTDWYVTTGAKATKVTIIVSNDATPAVPE